MRIVLVHGGVDAPTDEAYRQTLRRAALQGAEFPQDPVDAVVAAVQVLELDPRFNAGVGSVLNRDGVAEMDAALVDGATQRFGAVAAIQNVACPITVARAVLQKLPHVFLVGQGATEFARAQGFPRAQVATPEQRESWQAACESAEDGAEAPFTINPFTGFADNTHDTVGSVVLADDGRLAAGASTGGLFYKAPGRVGDSAILGAGLYASDQAAVACTGVGEAFVELLLAKQAESLVRMGLHPQAAAAACIDQLWQQRQAVGGMVVVDARGRVGAAYNGSSLPVAFCVDGELQELQPVQLERH